MHFILVVKKLPFPYYIVRFKQITSLSQWSSSKCFHTTQYDLNKPTYYQPKPRIASFHTTQYDLNNLYTADDTATHDCFHTTQYDLNRQAEARRKAQKQSFHTTQYDLNVSTAVGQIQGRSEFPYYIVRFKLFKGIYGWVMHRRVSILHSTI